MAEKLENRFDKNIYIFELIQFSKIDFSKMAFSNLPPTPYPVI